MTDEYFYLKEIIFAHEHTMYSGERCEYLSGREHYGLVLAMSGEAEYKLSSGEGFVLREGDVMLISSSAAYRVMMRGAFHHFTVNFDIEGEMPDGILGSEYRIFRTEHPDEYKQLMRRLVGIKKSRDGSRLALAAVFYEIIGMLLSEDIAASAFGESAARVDAARRYIDENFVSDTPLSYLARLTSMSVTGFRREWHRAYGMTPLQYRDLHRLSLARDKLISTRMTVGEIALLCGFDDTSYFIRFFKKHTGVSPTAFRKTSVML